MRALGGGRQVPHLRYTPLDLHYSMTFINLRLNYEGISEKYDGERIAAV